MIPITIVDDFLNEPHQLIELANRLEFTPDPSGMWPGTRSRPLHEVHEIFVLKLKDCSRDSLLFIKTAIRTMFNNWFIMC